MENDRRGSSETRLRLFHYCLWHVGEAASIKQLVASKRKVAPSVPASPSWSLPKPSNTWDQPENLHLSRCVLTNPRPSRVQIPASIKMSDVFKTHLFCLHLNQQVCSSNAPITWWPAGVFIKHSGRLMTTRCSQQTHRLPDKQVWSCDVICCSGAFRCLTTQNQQVCSSKALIAWWSPGVLIKRINYLMTSRCSCQTNWLLDDSVKQLRWVD